MYCLLYKQPLSVLFILFCDNTTGFQTWSIGADQKSNPPSSHIDIRIEALMPKVGSFVVLLFKVLVCNGQRSSMTLACFLVNVGII